MNRSGMFCYMCEEQLSNPQHFAFSDEGEILTMCTECYDDLKRFYIFKGVNASESRAVNKRHK